MNRVKKEEKKNPRKKKNVKVSWQKEQDELEPFAKIDQFKAKNASKKGR